MALTMVLYELFFSNLYVIFDNLIKLINQFRVYDKSNDMKLTILFNKLFFSFVFSKL